MSIFLPGLKDKRLKQDCLFENAKQVFKTSDLSKCDTDNEDHNTGNKNTRMRNNNNTNNDYNMINSNNNNNSNLIGN